jgi:hypothetical protein
MKTTTALKLARTLVLIGCASFEVSAYSQQLTIAQLQAALKNQYTPEAVQATGYVLGAYDAMAGIVHCPTGMTPTRDTLIKWTREGLGRYHGPNRGADHLRAAVFAERAPCAKRGLT